MSPHCWSKLPDHLLGLILERLPLTDYLRSGAVCVSWNSVIKKKEYRPKPQPWLLLRPIDDDNNKSNSAKLFNLSENKTYTIPLPPHIVLDRRNIIGSSFGWLITIDYALDMHLLNPVTGVQIQLPAITTLPSIRPFGDPQGRVEYIFVTSGGVPLLKRYSIRDILDQYFISKAILLPAPSRDGGGDFTVIIIHGFDKQLAIARSGDDTWTAILTPGNINSSFLDVVHHNGQVFAIDYNGSLAVWDQDGLSFTPKKIAQKPAYVSYKPYLAVNMSSGELLMVTSEDLDIQRGTVKFIRFLVLDKENFKWITDADGLKDNALFINSKFCVLFSTAEHPELRQRCAYYINPRPVNVCCYGYNLQIGYDLEMLDMERGSRMPIKYLGFHLIERPAMWITPSLF